MDESVSDIFKAAADKLEREHALRQAQVLEYGDELQRFIQGCTADQLRNVYTLLATAEKSPNTGAYYRGVIRGVLHYQHGDDLWGLVDLDMEKFGG